MDISKYIKLSSYNKRIEMTKRKDPLTPEDDLHLKPINPPADAVARQARPGVKAGNYLIDDYYKISKNNTPQDKKISKNKPKITPTTKLEDLAAYYSDIKAQENLAFIRVECGSNKFEIFKYLKEKRREIDKKYEQVLNPQDCYSFRGLDKVLKFLDKTPSFPRMEAITKVIHEQQHAKEARKRGYKINAYKCWLCLDEDNKPYYVLITQVKTSKFPSEKDYRAITAAPEDQSIIDMLSVPIPKIKKEKIGYK